MCLDEMSPESAKSFPGQQLVAIQEPPTPAIEASASAALPPVVPSAAASPVGRARQEADYGHRGKRYIFGAFKPADGEALAAPYAGRTTANYVDFLPQVEAWIAPAVERINAFLDNLNAHRATDVLLFSRAHPRWEFVF